ncbi:MAG: outer membrane beta-barrel protein [Candidatus Aminicenantes bacterium]|nr:outer membrane beta-barrel protein [Candidatus Aminicenantes bacterium]
MKKTGILIVAVTVVLSSLCGGQTFTVSLGAGIQSPADSGYRDIYGRSVFLPEIKGGISLSPSLYVWTGYGLVTAKGETPELKSAAESSQNFLSLGGGYQGALSDSLGFKAELGLADVFYKEEALGETVSGSALGFTAGAGLTYALGKMFFLQAEAGYLLAQKTINDVKVKMGGLKAGLGAGIRF